MDTIPVRVDEHGLDVEALARSRACAVLVTPAHQFPTGVVLSPERRADLLAWANSTDGWVIEDDYDGEFWYEATNRPMSLQTLSPERVIYGGTTSKTLAPGLRMGWLAAPSTLVRRLLDVRETFDLGSGTVDQLAYAEFIRSGLQDKHLRRVRATYSRRWSLVREHLIDNPDERLPDLQFTGAAAGLHTCLRFPPDLDEAEFVVEAQRMGVELRGAGRFRLARPDNTPGIVLGYAKESDAWLADVLGVLSDLAIKLRRSEPRR